MAGLWWNYVLFTSGPNSAHWNILTYMKSLTNAISMFYNNKVLTVLRKHFASTNHEMFIVWHIGNETPFYRPSVGTEPANIHFYWQGHDCFLITDRFQLVSWLSMPFCTSLSLCPILFPCVIPLYYTEHTHTHTQVHLKKCEYREKKFFFCNIFPKLKLSYIID